MENDEYLVSICIPTYNRCEYLKNCLESIVCQKEFLEGLAEVCISDNNSNDGTEELCREYAGKFRNINYFKHTEALVPEVNHAHAIEMGKGKLLKVSNDTLLYTHDSLKKMCAISEKYWKSKPFIFFVNENAECRGAYSCDEYISGNGRAYSFEEFLYNISYWMTFLGNFAYWNDDYSILNPQIDGYDSSMRQIYFVCEIFKNHTESIIVSDKIFDNQPVDVKNVSYGLYRVFYTNYLGILNSYMKEGLFSGDCYDFLKKDLLLGFFPIWVVRWEFNKGELRFSDEEELKELVEQASKENSCYKEYYEKYKKIKKDFVHANIKSKIRRMLSVFKNVKKGK